MGILNYITVALLILTEYHVTGKSIVNPYRGLYGMALAKTISENVERSVNSSYGQCSKFEHYSDAMYFGGNALVKVSDGMSTEQCREACLARKDFVCTGALVQEHSVCFITGYKLRNDFYSVHYMRTCKQAGDSCFYKHPFTTSGFTANHEVPWYFDLADVTAESYCMNLCIENDFCLGFDLVSTQERKVHCMFRDVSQIAAPTFDYYMRKC